MTIRSIIFYTLHTVQPYKEETQGQHQHPGHTEWMMDTIY